MAIKVGILKQNIIDILALPYKAGTPILLGDSNIEHMKKSHPYDYEIYCDEISNIIDTPDYVSLNKDDSIEYVKEFEVNNNFVKVAVRISISGILYARTLYSLNNKRVSEYIAKGTLKKV